MDQLALEIAGIPIQVFSNNSVVLARCAEKFRGYVATRDAGFRLTVLVRGTSGESILQGTRPSIDGDRIQILGEMLAGNIDLGSNSAQLELDSRQPVEDLEYFLRIIYTFLAFKVGGMLVHAAGVIFNNKAYVFLGHSGSGKSTASRLSMAHPLLSDDMVILLPQVVGWLAVSTPFWNPEFTIAQPVQARLDGIFFLHKASQIKLERMPRAETVAEMIANIPVITLDSFRSVTLLDRCNAILTEIPAYRLSFLRDVNFWPEVDAALGAGIL